MNGTGKRASISAVAVPRYWLIDKFGVPFGHFPSEQLAADAAASLWPDQKQDDERSGEGWDIEIQR